MRALALVIALAACGGSSAPAPKPPAKTPVVPEVVEEVDVDLALPVVSIKVTGLGPRTAAARALIGSELGQPVDPAQVARDEAALWAIGGLADLEVSAAGADDGVELVFHATARPAIAGVRADGAVAPQVDITGAIGLRIGDVFSPADAAAGRERLLTAYHEQGFARAEVTWSVSGSPVEIVYDVKEGPAFAIGSVGFRGNKAIATKQLTEILRAKVGVAAGKPYTPELVEAAVLYVNEAYYNRGYIVVDADPAEVTFDDANETVDLVFPIVEGAPYKISKITFQGTLEGTEKQYRKLLGVKVGDVFDRSKVAAGLDALRPRHPDVMPLTKLDEAKHTVELTIELETRYRRRPQGRESGDAYRTWPQGQAPLSV